jgi:hypothetical protein
MAGRIPIHRRVGDVLRTRTAATTPGSLSRVFLTIADQAKHRSRRGRVRECRPDPPLHGCTMAGIGETRIGGVSSSLLSAADSYQWSGTSGQVPSRVEDRAKPDTAGALEGFWPARNNVTAGKARLRSGEPWMTAGHQQRPETFAFAPARPAFAPGEVLPP